MQSCLGCGRVPTALNQGQPAHIHTWGASHTDEANLLPLCVDCHAIQHTIGILTWARSLGLADGWEVLEALGVRYWRIFVNGEDFFL